MNTDQQDHAALEEFIAKTKGATVANSIRPWFWGIYYERKEIELLLLRIPETPENKTARDEILGRVRYRAQ